MINLAKAVGRIEKRFPDERIIGCSETDKYYGFWLYPRSMKEFSRIRSNIVPCVDKSTGKVVVVLGFDYNSFKKLDCSNYLSEEDAIIFRSIRDGKIKFSII